MENENAKWKMFVTPLVFWFFFILIDVCFSVFENPATRNCMRMLNNVKERGCLELRFSFKVTLEFFFFV